MKVMHFAVLAGLVLLSPMMSTHAPVVAQAVNPCAPANPCAGNPCAGKNPCAATNPCAGVNPCAAANPCAGVNPCAGQAASVGGPLAEPLHGKPVVVDIYAEWCPACRNIAPTVSQLQETYGNDVHFVVLDVTDRATTAEAEALAAELGLSEFFEANKSQTGSLTIVEPETGAILVQHRNNANFADYQSVLDVALAP